MKRRLPDLSALREGCTRLIRRFKIPLLLLALGLALLALPRSEKSPQEAQAQAAMQPEADQTADEIQSRLASLLAQIDGVGRAELLLSQAESAEAVYQTDVRRSGSDTGYSEEQTTVLRTLSASQKEPVVTMTKEPVYRGAVVVCDGADSAAVRLSVIHAVSTLTGLGSDKITVVKMKGH